MKKSICFLLLALFANSLSLIYSHSIRLQFQPDSPIDSIKIENLDNQTSHTFLGGGSLLFFFGTPTSVEKPLASDNELSVFSTPDRDEVSINFNQESPGFTTCEVYDLQGRLIGAVNGNFKEESQQFTFVPHAKGVYLVRVTSGTVIKTGKFISYSTSAFPKLFKSESGQKAAFKAPASSFQIGQLVINQNDLIRIKCFSGTKSQTIYDYASADKNYVIKFTNPYNQLRLFNVVASKPSFVDVMYSISDAEHKGIDGLKNSDFVVKEDNVTMSATETFRHVLNLSQNQVEIKTILLIDNSISIVNDLEAVRNAAMQFVRKIRPNQKIALYVFSDVPTMLQDFTNDTLLLKTAISKMSVGFPSTNLYGSIINALSKWTDGMSSNNFTHGSLIVFTDGNDTQGSSTINQVISARGQKKVFVVGLGNGVSPATLNQIAFPSPYLPIQSIPELESTFNSIQLDIVRTSNSIYWLNYMSPKRSGTHTIEVSKSMNTNTSANSKVSGSFSATGFQSVNSGVYVNISDTKLYGVDSIFCFYDENTYNFTVTRYGNIVSKDSLVLKPTTYWAFKQPEYEWSLSNNSYFDLNASGFNSVELQPKEGDTISTTFTINDINNAYAKQVIMQMHPENVIFRLPTVEDITSKIANFKGAVLKEGRLPILDKGFVWSTETNPTISLTTKISTGAGKGNMNANFSNFKTGTVHYLRAYATNSLKTTYSNETTFKTLVGLPELVTLTPTSITFNSAVLGGEITHDGGAEITERGVCWSINPSPTINDSILKIGSGSFESIVTELQRGIIYYVRAYAMNSAGTAYGNEKSFSLLGIVTSSTGRVWLDRNLGATRVATSSVDEDAYGDLYQWGRGTDGHEKRTSQTTSSLSSSDSPGHGQFITASTEPYDWRVPQNNNLWQGVNGINNPCPEGFRVPNKSEWETEISSWNTNNSAGAYQTNLKLTLAGGRSSSNGLLNNINSIGYYWSNTFDDTYAWSMNFNENYASLFSYGNYSAGGASIRCIKELELPIVTTESISDVTVSSAITGGVVAYDGGSLILSRGVCWSTTENPTITNSKTSNGSGTGSFVSSISGLQPTTTYFVRAYATNSAGTAYGAQISFTTSSLNEGEVYNPATGKVWMDRNLGANRVATSSTDAEAYGDLYQWGRGTDGHEKRNSQTTSSLSNTDIPGHGMFYIAGYNDNFDWRNPQNNSLWQGVQGINNPCPEGFRIPTIAEWEAEQASWVSINSAGAFKSTLILPLAGRRDGNVGTIYDVGSQGSYWSSDVNGLNAVRKDINVNISRISYSYRAFGASVRCIKD